MKKNLSGKDYIDLGVGGLMSGFGGMLYESEEGRKNRLVARYSANDDKLIIDTAYTPDTGCFETGVTDFRYVGGEDWVIVEEYSTKEKAQRGHDKWVKLLTSNKLPKELEDVHDSRFLPLRKVKLKKKI